VPADRVRPRRQRDEQRHERHDDPELGASQVERRLGDGGPRLLVEHGGDQPQHVHGGEHDRDRSDDRPAPGLLEDAREDQELAREVRRQRDRERDYPRRHQHRRERRPPSRHAAEERELTRRGAPLDHAGEQEQRRRDEAVVDHLQDGAARAEAVRGEEAVRDQAHLRERRVRHDAAHVRRTEREQRTVDEPDRGEHEDRDAEVVGRPRELLDRNAEEAVRGDLRDDAGEKRRHLGGRLAVRAGQPAVERPERRLHREGDREAEEEPVVRAHAHPGQVECALLQAVDDDRRQHQQGAGDGVDDERDRRPHPPRAAPDADQHVERDQHRLEEGVEEEQVLRGEHADDGARQEEEQPEVRPRPLAAHPPGVEARRRSTDGGEPDQPERVAELPDVVADAEVAEPRVALRELQVAAREVEPLDRGDPDRHLDERHQCRQRADPFPGHRHEPDDERSHGGQEDQDGGQPARHRVVRKTTASTATPLASASA
jgi:hypothetical protein